MKKLLCFILTLSIMLSLSSTALAVTSGSGLTTQHDAFVMDQVRAFINSGDESVTWNARTKISSCIELYAPDNTINGYIYSFTTDRKDSGFMQIGVLNDEFYVVNLGFEGKDILTKMIEQYSIQAFSNKTVSPLQPSTSKSPSKVYYTGGFNYYTYNSDNNLVALSDYKIIEAGISELLPEYNTFVEHISTISVTAPPQRATTTYTVNGFYSANSYMKTTSYWSSYSNHCSPTAATNMVMYWKYGRGFFANHSASANQTSVFTWFYNNMHTDPVTGTAYANILPAYVSYFRAYSGASSSVYDQIENVNFSDLYVRLNGNTPVHLSVEDYAGGGNHAVNVWGYSIVSDANYLRISDNWGSYFGVVLINFDTYDYSQYVFYSLS